MKIAVTGKGGVGKTTIAATLARLYAAEGKRVYKVWVIANKIRDEKDEEFIKSKIPQEDLLGFVHYNLEVIDADREGASPYEHSKKATEEIMQLKDKIDKEKY